MTPGFMLWVGATNEAKPRWPYVSIALSTAIRTGHGAGFPLTNRPVLVGDAAVMAIGGLHNTARAWGRKNVS